MDRRVKKAPPLSFLASSAILRVVTMGRAMLVLSRKVGEKILIGDYIAVTVVRIAPGVVRIGVEAPDDMPIVREEIKNQAKSDARQRGASAPS
jgi:carbon storage regulator